MISHIYPLNLPWFDTIFLIPRESLPTGFMATFLLFTINSEVFLQALHSTCPLKIWCSQGAQLLCFYILPPGGDWTYFCPSNSLSSSLSHCYRDQSHSRAAQHHLTCLASWPGAPDMPHRCLWNLLRADTCSPENQRVKTQQNLIKMVDQVSRINASPVSSDLSWSFKGMSNQSPEAEAISLLLG